MNSAASAGVSLKPQHYDAALTCTAEAAWFEVHPENYMVQGGPRLAWLQAIRERHPVALHGVALSLAADAVPDPLHLRRLLALVERIEPFLITEHLAWSAWREAYFPDLLPFPRTSATLARIVDNVSRVQDALCRPIAVENPSHYLRMDAHEWGEIDFMTELAQRSGCGLLLDINNVYVSGQNLGYSAEAYIDAFPARHVAEIHLAGHTPDPTHGEALLIDSHDAPVAPAVWSLYARAVDRIGARPTLVERDGNVPAFEILLAERERAQAVLCGAEATLVSPLSEAA